MENVEQLESSDGKSSKFLSFLRQAWTEILKILQKFLQKKKKTHQEDNDNDNTAKLTANMHSEKGNILKLE